MQTCGRERKGLVTERERERERCVKECGWN